MIYGLYLSATGVLTNSYRQDVIANNLANAETVGFKRDVALFRERLTEAQTNRLRTSWSNPDLDLLSGGTLAMPTSVDSQQGELEPTGNKMDLAIVGNGYFQVENAKGDRALTRDGRFMIDGQGQLVLSNGSGDRVLDVDGNPIVLAGGGEISFDDHGAITQNAKPVGSVGVFDVPDASRLAKQGGTMLSYPDMSEIKLAENSTVRGEFIERANVDPATELAELMDAQRQLEANANMIRYQDQMLGKLVNEVGKIS